MMFTRLITIVLGVGSLLTLFPRAQAATAFLDDFNSSSLNSLSPAAPTDTSASYHLFSSKGWAPSPSVTANNLRFGINSTSSGHIEAQALFTTTPLALAAVGDYVELVVTFTNSSGLFTQSGMVGFGLYDSGGVPPIAGGMESTAVVGTTGVTGGAQGWQGYVSRIWYDGEGSHNIATRPAQSITTGNNQDLVTEGSSSQSYLDGVELSSAASTFSQASGSQLTESLKITLSAPGTLTIESRLYAGGSTGGTLLFNQTGTATGGNLLTSTFDALCVGWRDRASSDPTLIEIRSIRINTSLPVGGGNDVAGMYFQQQPTDVIAGDIISPAVAVVATNLMGSPVTNVTVDLSLLSGTAPLNGDLSQNTDAGGVATFNNLSLTASGLKQLRASSGLASVDSAAFTVSTAPASQLVFATPPSETDVSAVITPPVVAQLQDVYGNDVASNVTVSLTLLGTGTLNGTTSVPSDGTGKSTFGDLSIDTIGTKQLRASTAGLPTVDSTAFNIVNPVIYAFPGAEGAGANALGGRGGDVYYVTTLADNNSPGSLRYGINTAPASGRTICFKVSGNIVLNSTLTINRSRITVAGQTAPGDGICFQNYSFNIAASDIVVRHLRSRLGTNAWQEADCMWINSGSDIIVDHLSTSWSVDEVLSASTDVSNLTVQNCFITEALNNSIHSKGAHGYGSIVSSDLFTTYSYLRNLYAHNRSRNPRIGSSQDPANPNTLRLDFRNNVIYDYGDRAGYTGGSPESCEVNYVGNYCIKGPSSSYNYILQGGGTTTHVYQDANYIDLNLNGLVDGANTGWSMFSGTYTPFGSAFAVPAATTESAPTAYERVVALAGAMPWRRDSADRRVAQTVREQNGMVIDAVAQVGTWPTLIADPAPADTDSDGMPDYWEMAVGLNRFLASDRNLIDPSGYTELEVYLDWLADAHALCDRNGQVDVDLRAATGSSSNLTFNVADGSNGTVTLLGDGHTARFVAAANTNGVADFTFMATDSATAVSFGPIDYGILISTTNAPVSNTPPVLSAIPDQAGVAGTNFSFTASVTDTDTPPQAITFTLQNGPSGATLNTNTGDFHWRPGIAQSPSTNLLSLIATDDGVPPMSATQSFTLTVLEPVAPTLASQLLPGGVFKLTVSGDVGPDYIVQASTNLMSWNDIFTNNSPNLPFPWTDPDSTNYPQRFYRILLGP